MNCDKKVVSLLMLLLTAGCDSNEQLSQFSSDGCSLFPDESLISHHNWCACCLEHDIAYWQGGTQQQRLTADMALKNCVLEKTQDAVLAKIMYEGVRVGGSPYFYNWYRWGYGWPYERKYQALTKREQVEVEKHLSDFQRVSNNVCE